MANVFDSMTKTQPGPSAFVPGRSLQQSVLQRVGFAIDPGQLDRIEQELAQFATGMPTVVSRAVNKTAVWGRQRLLEKIQGERPAIKAGIIRAAIQLLKATAASMTAVAKTSGKRIPLYKLGSTPRTARYRGGRVQVQGLRGGLTTPPDSFTQRMPWSGHLGAFQRRGPKELMAFGKLAGPKGFRKRRAARSRYAGQMRQRIFELYGPSMPQVVIDLLESDPGLLAEINDRLAMEMDRQVGVFLQQRAVVPGSAAAGGDE